jgi:hypothetical protein
MITNKYVLAVMLLAILVTFWIFVATVISSEREEQRTLCMENCRWTDWPEGSDAWRFNYQCINDCDKTEHDVPKLFDNLSKTLSYLYIHLSLD